MRKVLLAAALLALAVVPAALAAPTKADGNSQTFLDSTGENANAPDITSIVVSNDDAGLVTFKINISNRPSLTSDMEIDLYLDTDANSATGDPQVSGADYAIVLDLQDGAGLLKWNGSNYADVSSRAPSLVYSYGASGATIKVNASDLGGRRSSTSRRPPARALSSTRAATRTTRTHPSTSRPTLTTGRMRTRC